MANFDNTPYFDDFDEAQKFLKILFRPGYAVQTRELNQAQTILQNQLSRIGNHVFKDGAMVIPGNIGSEIVGYVKINSTNVIGENVSTFLTQLDGTVITGQTSGVSALVVKTIGAENSDPITLMVKYVNSGTDAVSTTFQDDEVLVNDSLYPLQVSTIGTSACGNGTIVSIKKGIYYIRGYFVLVDDETIVLEKYSTIPSYRIGLSVSETIITPEMDSTLYDNAFDSPNASAPGAHRFKIQTSLVKLALNSTNDSNFIELLRLEENAVQLLVNTTQYSELERTLARRTYDESGDYIVDGMGVSLLEHRSNNRGERTNSTQYIIGDIVTNSGNTYVARTTGTSGTSAPTFVTDYSDIADGTVTWQYTDKPIYNQGIYVETGDESKFIAAVAPGKAYVRGYELEKFNVSYVPVDKARTYENNNSVAINSTLGNYVLVSNIYSIFENLGTTCPLVQLYDHIIATNGSSAGTNVGSARVRWLEVDSSNTSYYRLYLFNIVMYDGYNFERDVKSFYYNNTSLTQDFTANVVPVLSQLSGSIVASSTSITGTGTKFLTELTVGDYIQCSSGGTTYKILVSSITNDNTLVISGGPTITVGVAYYLITTAIQDSDKSSPIFLLPNSFIKNVKDITNSSQDTVYNVTKYFPRTQATGTTLVLNVDNPTYDTFLPISAQNYTVIEDTGVVATGYSMSLNISSQELTITGLSNNAYYTVLASIRKHGMAEKSKTLVTAYKDITTLATATLDKILLDKADVHKILSIKQAPAFGTINGSNVASLDVMNNYKFDNGQRSTHYDLGSISLLSNAPIPTGSIRVYFQYFTHGTGDYFSVDSYTNKIPYNEILPTLRDSFDFRPRISDDGTTFTSNTVPKNGYNIEADYSYYLGRRSNIELDIYGNFNVSNSTPAIVTKEPVPTNNSMMIAKLNVDPYTLFANSSSIDLETINNKRYTMQDIGKLEKRISNVEYYTSLSLLEQETKSLTILDSNGMDRFKNGFFVDSFNGHGNGNIYSIDYRCSIDPDQNIMRSMFNMDNIDLIEYNLRNTNNYQVTGDIISLPYTHQVLVDQPFASRVENVNPFAVFTFIGNTTMKPFSDNWFETKYAPNVVIHKEGNFNTLAAIAYGSNMIGTSWGAWNNIWTGNVKQDNFTVLYEGHGYGRTLVGDTNNFGSDYALSIAGNTFIAGHQSFNVTSTDIVQSRTGIRTSIVAKYDTQEIANKIIATSVIPYMRSRNVLFVSRGLKPVTKFYPFFDSIDISQYITPASILKINAVTGYLTTFDTSTNVANDGTNIARQFDRNVETALTSGDVITGKTSGATAIVVLQENGTNDKYLHIVNKKGTFILSETIIGSISGARATIGSIDIKSVGDNIITNSNGDVCGIFKVPNTNALKFKTGTHEFKLTSDSQNTGTADSQSRASFSASGVVNTNQKTIVSTRNAEIVREQVTERRSITERNVTITGAGWYDPLAQSFMVSQSGGAFLTKVDLYFATKDVSIPVQLEIREMVNGYPANKILPNSHVTLTPDLVNISSNTVTLVDGNVYNSPDVATTFTFSSPVYVQDGIEYCIVLISDSNNYRVWISQLGDKIATGNRYISEQPYAGVLFKSQNASTWTANQDQDLTFKLYRAKFDTSVTGSVKFNNIQNSLVQLTSQSLQTLNGSTLVRVYQSNHGFINGNKVTFTGFSGTYNGIPDTELNAQHTVANCDFNSYTITVTTSATSTGLTGSSNSFATRNIRYEKIGTNMGYLDFPDTSISVNVKGTSTSGTYDSSYTPLTLEKDLTFYGQKTILSSENESTYLSGAKSFEMVATLMSSNDAVSPIIDTHRLSIMAISNIIDKIDSNVSTGYISTTLDTRTLASGAVFAIDGTNKKLTTSDGGTIALFKTVNIGKYVTLSGCTNTANNGTYLVTNVDYSGGTYITLGNATLINETASPGKSVVINEYWLDEIAGIGGNASSKYVTPTISFINPSTHCTIMFAYNMPSYSNIEVYYKPIPNNGSINIDQIPFIKLSATGGLIQSDDNLLYDATYSVDTTNQFTKLIVKIVSKSSNTAFVPVIKDLRIIACA